MFRPPAMDPRRLRLAELQQNTALNLARGKCSRASCGAHIFRHVDGCRQADRYCEACCSCWPIYSSSAGGSMLSPGLYKRSRPALESGEVAGGGGALPASAADISAAAALAGAADSLRSPSGSRAEPKDIHDGRGEIGYDGGDDVAEMANHIAGCTNGIYNACRIPGHPTTLLIATRPSDELSSDAKFIVVRRFPFRYDGGVLEAWACNCMPGVHDRIAHITAHTVLPFVDESEVVDSVRQCASWHSCLHERALDVIDEMQFKPHATFVWSPPEAVAVSVPVAGEKRIFHAAQLPEPSGRIVYAVLEAGGSLVDAGTSVKRYQSGIAAGTLRCSKGRCNASAARERSCPHVYAAMLAFGDGSAAKLDSDDDGDDDAAVGDGHYAAPSVATFPLLPENANAWLCGTGDKAGDMTPPSIDAAPGVRLQCRRTSLLSCVRPCLVS